MKKLLTLPLILLILALANPAQAMDFNLINIDMGSPESQKLNNTYSKAYGFTPQQTAPAMYGPAEEVPTILKIAQAAGTLPMTVWSLRKAGMNFGNILSTFSLAPAALMGGSQSPNSYGPNYSPTPGWGGFMDPFIVQSSRVYFLRNVLKVPTRYLPLIPFRGPEFAQSIVRPYHPVHGSWMPPGIAKKYGLWVPPGQRKKMGWYGDRGKQHGKHGWKHKGHDGAWGYKTKSKNGPHGQEKYSAKGKGPNGKWDYKYEKKGGKEKAEYSYKGKGGKKNDVHYSASKTYQGSEKNKGSSSSKSSPSKGKGGSKGKWK